LVLDLHLLQIGLTLGEAAGGRLSFQTAAGQGEAPTAQLAAAALDAVGDAAYSKGVAKLEGFAEVDEKRFCVVDELTDKVSDEILLDGLPEKAKLVEDSRVDRGLGC
jgi:hypothetical protein